MAYRVENYKNTAEREQFRFLCEQLAVHYKESEELCVFAGNYNIGCELDALLIKNDAIITIEFKNYGGHIVANENGNWTSDGKVVKGGTRATVLQQARTNHSIVKRELKCLGIKSTQIKDVPTLVVFHQPIELENKLSGTTKSWLHITDDEHFLNKIDDITCPKTDLSREEIIKLVELLNLSPYLLNEFSSAGYDELESQPIKVEPSKDANGEKEEKVVQEKTEKLPILVDSSSQSVDIEIVGTVHQDAAIFTEDTGFPNKKNHNNLSLLRYDASRIIKRVCLTAEFEIEALGYNEFCRTFPSYSTLIKHEHVVVVKGEFRCNELEHLQEFLHKEIQTLSSDIFFWEEGDSIGERDFPDKSSVDTSVDPPVVTSENSLILPKWLDTLLYNKMKAKYSPDYAKYAYNLNLSKEDALVYLGTYFPRSYAETFYLFSNFLCNSNYSTLLKDKESINILDLGCGTGGDIIGLLSSIEDVLPSARSVKIYAVDGNQPSLKIFERIINEYKTQTRLKIEYVICPARVEREDDLTEIFNAISIMSNKFEFVISCKAICEIAAKGIVKGKAYKRIAKMLSEELVKDGVLLLEDVTVKNSSGEFIPVVFNRELNEFIRENGDFVTLLPVTCNKYVGKCIDGCFFKKEIKITHSMKTNDLSKIVCRFICHKEFSTHLKLGKLNGVMPECKIL